MACTYAAWPSAKQPKDWPGVLGGPETVDGNPLLQAPQIQPEACVASEAGPAG